LDEDARQVDLVGIEFTRFVQLLDLGDRDLARHRGEGVEVAGAAAEDEVAVAVALPGPHEGEIGDDRLFEDIRAGNAPHRQLPGLLRG
jgi:hypothetical protein